MKIFETIDDKKLYPLSMKIIDTPGNLRDNKAQIQYSFVKPSLIMLVFDYSKILNRQSVIDWTMFAIRRVQEFHPSFNLDKFKEGYSFSEFGLSQSRDQEEINDNDDYLQKDVNSVEEASVR